MALILESSPGVGRRWVAGRDLPQGTSVIACAPYAAAVFDSAKKRCCSVCLKFERGENDGLNRGAALPFHCPHCDAVYACSSKCYARLLGELEHHVVCAALRRLATAKLDPHARSVSKLVLLVLCARLNDMPSRYWVAEPETTAPVPGSITVPRFHAYTGDPEAPQETQEADDITFYSDPSLLPQTQQGSDAFLRAKAAWDSAETVDATSPTSMDGSNNPTILETKELPPDPSAPQPSNTPAVVLSAPGASPARPVGRAKPKPRGGPDRLWEKDPVDLDKLERSKREAWESAEKGTWKDVLRLQTHAREWTKEEVMEWRRTIHHHLLPLLLASSLLPAPLVATPQLAERFLLDLISALESNAFGIWTSGRAGVNCGRGVWLGGAPFANHSCEPNCEVVQGLAAPDSDELTSPALLRIVTSAAVPKGTELTISYTDTNAPLAARRDRLLAEYRFKCACPRCTREEEQGRHAKISYERSFQRGQQGQRGGRGGQRGPPMPPMPSQGGPGWPPQVPPDVAQQMALQAAWEERRRQEMMAEMAIEEARMRQSQQLQQQQLQQQQLQHQQSQQQAQQQQRGAYYPRAVRPGPRNAQMMQGPPDQFQIQRQMTPELMAQMQGLAIAQQGRGQQPPPMMMQGQAMQPPMPSQSPGIPPQQLQQQQVPQMQGPQGPPPQQAGGGRGYRGNYNRRGGPRNPGQQSQPRLPPQ